MIYSPNIANGNTALYVRCTNDLLEVFFSAESIIDPLLPIYYKLDYATPLETSVFGLGSDSKSIFFDNADIQKFFKNLLFSHYFSVVVNLSDRLQSYTFDLTGFGQAVKALPCALKILNP